MVQRRALLPAETRLFQRGDTLLFPLFTDPGGGVMIESPQVPEGSITRRPYVMPTLTCYGALEEITFNRANYPRFDSGPSYSDTRPRPGSP